jgi:hypothetical protein
MSLESTTCEGINWLQVVENDIIKNLRKISDLKAFERRLTEVLACLQPSCLRWRSKSLKIKSKYLINLFLSTSRFYLYGYDGFSFLLVSSLAA